METNIIYNRDNVQGLKDHIDNNNVDLTVTSPPYDDLRNYKGADWDFGTLAKELYRVTKEGGVVVWIVGDRTIDGDETGESFRQVLCFKDVGFKLHDTMIYMKDSISFPETNRYSQVFEYMFVLSKGIPKTTNIIKDHKNKWADGKKQIKGRERQTDGSLIDRRNGNTLKKYGARFNVWQISTGYMKSTKDKIAYDHPAIFPEQLAGDHIKSWSNEGDIILDPFMGSGTTAKMAIKLDRKYIGFEINQEYCDISERRIKEIQKPLID